MSEDEQFDNLKPLRAQQLETEGPLKLNEVDLRQLKDHILIAYLRLPSRGSRSKLANIPVHGHKLPGLTEEDEF